LPGSWDQADVVRDADSLEDYRKLGLQAVVGGKLTPARNMALDVAKRKKQMCVQISDDISKWEYFDVEKQNFRGEVFFDKANAAVHGARRLCVSPLAAAQFILAKMRSSPLKPHLGGVFPTLNAALSLGQEEYSTHHFILGDFFVAEPASPCRFDTSMTLKEDYDFSCAHIHEHGSVLRCNRMFAYARHATNAGGAVATRDSTGSKERANIAILMRKWPDAFYLNGKRKDEVIMKWPRRDTDAEGTEKGSNRSARTSGGSSRAKVVKKAGGTAKVVVGAGSGFDLSSKVKRVKEVSAKAEYINKRTAALDGKTVRACLKTFFRDAAGRDKPYRMSDLRYDVTGGSLRILK